jgi:hypothetical protein
VNFIGIKQFKLLFKFLFFEIIFVITTSYFQSSAWAGSDRSLIGHLLGWEEKLCENPIEIIGPKKTIQKAGALKFLFLPIRVPWWRNSKTLKC